MTCEEVMEYMQRQLDDDLDDHEADALTAHTRYCSDCADMLERLKRLSAELDNLPKVVPAFSLVDAIIPQLDRIDSDRQVSGIAIDSTYSDEEGAVIAPVSRRSSPDRDRSWLKRISWPAVTGVAAAGLVAGLFLVLFNPVNSPELKSDAKMETATAESMPAAESTAMDRSAKKSSTDEVRIESTHESESTRSSATSSQPNEKQSAVSAERFATGSAGEENKVAPYSEVPIDNQAGDAVPLAPGDEAASHDGTSGSANVSKVLEAPLIAKDQFGEPFYVKDNGLSASADISDISNVVLSPDGTLSAAIVEGAVLVYATEEGTVRLDSGKQTGDVSNLEWSDDSKALFFEVKDESGQSKHYKIDTRDWTIAAQ